MSKYLSFPIKRISSEEYKVSIDTTTMLASKSDGTAPASFVVNVDLRDSFVSQSNRPDDLTVGSVKLRDDNSLDISKVLVSVVQNNGGLSMQIRFVIEGVKVPSGSPGGFR